MSKPEPGAGPTISVVIPCFNEERHIGKLLDDLAAQTEQPHAVVASDCTSEDGTIAVAKQFAHKLPLQIVHSPRRSPAAARNAGADALRCHPEDYLVFMDADMRIPQDFLEQLRTAISEHPVDFITPAFLSDGLHRVDTLSIQRINVHHQWIIMRKHKVAGIGGVMLVRKSMHDAVGGFPEVNQDDLGYIARLNDAGASAYFAADIHAINSSRRLRHEGTLHWLLGVMPESWRATKLLARLFRKDISTRQYGHYTKKQ